ncbi:MAG: hypothetical protein R2789_06535 [Microthrixaceae bacterium]
MAGAEALAVGTLIVLAGLILVVNAWAVVDTRTALESAARVPACVHRVGGPIRSDRRKTSGG